MSAPRSRFDQIERALVALADQLGVGDEAWNKIGAAYRGEETPKAASLRLIEGGAESAPARRPVLRLVVA